MSFEFRKVDENDIGDFYDICFSASENKIYSYQTHLLDRNRILQIFQEGGSWICLDGNKKVGICCGTLSPYPHIFGLFVRPKYEGKGISERLLSNCLQWFHSKGANEAISPANAPAPLQAIAVAISVGGKMGIPVQAILANSSVTLDDLQNPEKMTMVTHEQKLIVFGNLLSASKNSSIGLLIGKSLDLYTYDILGATMLVAPTLGDALQCLFDFPLLSVCYFKQSLRIEGEMAIAVASGYHYRPDLMVMNTDMCLASWYMQMSGVLGEPLKIEQLTFIYNELPAHASFYPKIFGCDAQFGAPENAIHFPAKLLAMPLPRANPIQYHMMRGYCEHLHKTWAAKQVHDITTQVLLLLRSSPSRYGSLNLVAETLHISPKTLSRRLGQSNSAFQHLLDRARHDLALDYLVHTALPVNQIAEALGYAETSSFRRAFLRWTGQSPADYRASNPSTTLCKTQWSRSTLSPLAS
ncbi:MAG: AraC-type DNA-binding protein [Glomeribacter sp. 1016415]|nr:AraC-type DNA-binding protein [Glomeribacter sp. 1016415]